tara:strand:- start:808 stop:1038 length:231 start_codon:yes stop_codon:yes gene_type:complete
MAKQPGQYGQNAIWDGPSKPSNLVPGNSRYGMNCMKIAQMPLKYQPGPITMKAQANIGGDWPEHMEGAVYHNPTAK